MRKYLIRNRRKIGIIFIIAFFFIMFPYTVTMINFGKTRGVVYEPETYGKSVVIKNNNKTMEIDVQMFVPLVVYSMMPVKYEKEALKAQMVIIRTFILYKMGDNNSIFSSIVYSLLQPLFRHLYFSTSISLYFSLCIKPAFRHLISIAIFLLLLHISHLTNTLIALYHDTQLSLCNSFA